MHGGDVFDLGRRLIRIGLAALPPSQFRELSAGVRIVGFDVFDHPGTTIGAIVERTGFPQSHVSESVARLRELGVLVTATDPCDRRRTLVSPSPDHTRGHGAEHSLPGIDDALRAAITESRGHAPAAEEVASAAAALRLLADTLGLARTSRTPSMEGDQPNWAAAPACAPSKKQLTS